MISRGDYFEGDKNKLFLEHKIRDTFWTQLVWLKIVKYWVQRLDYKRARGGHLISQLAASVFFIYYLAILFSDADLADIWP